MQIAPSNTATAIHHWVELTAFSNPTLPAICIDNEVITYGALNERANQLAFLLNQDPSIKGKRVGICLERSPELMIAILAVLKAGAAYVPFDAEYPTDRIQYMVEISAIPAMISTSSLINRLPSGNYKNIILDNWSVLEKFQTTNLDLEIPVLQPAYVLFTSGSTGKPKGVVMPHQALSNLIDWQLKNTSVHKEGRTLQFAPISFDVHFQEIFCTWADAGCIYLITDELRLNTLQLLNYLEEQKINRLFLPFIALQNLAEIAVNNKNDLSSLKEIITAGEQLQVTPALINFFERLNNCKLFNHYGPTEAHVVSSYEMEGAPKNWPKLPSIGKAIQGVELYILDEKNKIISNDSEGELFIAGICLAEGYLNRDDLTKERFIENPFVKGSKMYRTGDLAKRDAQGNLHYLGRIDGQVKVRGYRIELGEIEVVLARFNGVSQIAVTVREDKVGEKKLVAYLVMNDENELNIKSIRSFLHTQLPDYMMPSAFVQMTNLPRTPSGKIDRKSLPIPDQKRPELGVPFIAASTSTQKTLATLWSRLLNIEPIGIEDNFFDSGGNSLLALQSVALLKQEYGIDLSIVKIYQLPTIAALSNVIDGNFTEVNLKDEMRKRAEARHKSGNNNVEDGIAIIGMALNVPGAESPEALWENLKNGVESITHFTDNDLDSSIPFEIKNDPHYVKARGIMKDAEGFDAAFFHMNPNVAKVTDPQQRILLELSWNALENAGYCPNNYKGLIGVFAGSGNNTYYHNNVIPNPIAISRVGNFLTMTQNEKDYIATRIAFELNLKGLAVSVNTGCSTSLTAVTQACEALWNHQCDMSLAGGVAITAPIRSGQMYEEGAMFSNDGHTRAFDSLARGTAFSDGAGLVVLKRYKDAVADGDTIYAIIRGAALNNDGGDKGSFTAPSVDGQASVISMAQAMAGVDPRSISYVETHGTATPLGDPIEVEGLIKAFREHTPDKQFCAIGSIKTNIGHLTAAAGVAGLIKTALSLYHKQLPATLHYKEPNPQIPFTTSPFFVNDKFRDWNTDQLPRRAGVSSFGVGGTNAHLILEEAPTVLSTSPERSKHLITLSAKTETALASRIDQLKNYLENDSEVLIADVASTLQTGRYSFNHRWFATVANREDAITQLTQADPKRSSKHLLKNRASGVVFMFPGQGSQYVGMGSNLYRDELVFRESVDRCSEILLPFLGRDIKELLFANEGNEDAENLLKQTYFTQPALFTIGYSLAQLWMSWGIQPSALIGHSIGEFVAATIAGVFTLEDALTVVATRSNLMQNLPEGSMLSVRLSASAIEKYLSNEVSIAAINGPQLCVIAGPHEVIASIQSKLEKEEIICKPLYTSHAFHSPMMDAIIEPFENAVKKVKLNAPKIPILSTVTTVWLQDSDATNPNYWAKHLRATVKFADGVKSIWNEHPNYVMLELGPRNTATTLARQQSIDPKSQKAIPSLGDSASNDAEWVSLLSAIGQLWLVGIEINWSNFYTIEHRKHVPLPGYPFEHVRYWLDPPQQLSFQQSSINISQEHHSPSLISSFHEDQKTLNTTMNNRKDNLIDEIRLILEDSSGIEMGGADPTSSFIELGLDSLFLTQIALTLSKKYAVKITFRQLNEDLSSLENIANYLDQQLPKEQNIATKQSTQPASSANQNIQMPSIPVGNNGGEMQWLIQQQMQIMQQQLQMMSGQSLNNNSPTINSTPASTNIPSTNDFSISPDEHKELKKPFGAIARIEKVATNQFTEKQTKWLSSFTSAYNQKTKKSKAYTQEHRAHLADPRVVTGFRPAIKELIYQPVVNRSLGSKIWDIDGNEYVDVLNGFGSNMFGHNPPFIVKALEEQLSKGYELGPQHELAGEVAKLICEFTKFDRAGFCNTGSEAVLGAMRIARTITGRSTIISFNGSYHGINDEVILRGSKKLKSVPASAGIPVESVQNMLVLDYGTPEALEIIRSRAHEIAAVLVEPVQSRRADFYPTAFLQEVRKITEQAGALLIFDEVITGFRISQGGAQAYYNIKADLGTYGKIVGGGMPIGVIAGKKEFMDSLDGGHWQYGDNSVPEVGVTYFAGTFVRHPFALAAAKATLLHMQERGEDLQKELNEMTAALETEVNEFCHQNEIPFHLVHFGSLFKPKYDLDMPNIDLLYCLLRYKGIHIYDGFPCFITEGHSKEDISFIAKQFKDSLYELMELGFIPGIISTSSKPIYSNGNGSSNGNGKSETKLSSVHTDAPPVEGALLGKNPDGTPGWFVQDPNRPGKYLKVNFN